MVLRLVLMRHGKAEPPGEKPDEERSLTEEGRRDVEAVARLIPFKPSAILCSPLRRAVETASIISMVHRVPYRIEEGLSPGIFSVEALQQINPPDQAVLVGHAPSIERVTSALVGGGFLKIGAGGMAIIELENLERSGGRLVLLIQPELAIKCLRGR